MNEIMRFTSEEFGEVRSFIFNDGVWFIAKDISERLDYKDIEAMTRRLDSDEKSVLSVENIKNLQIIGFENSLRGVSIINESGLYHSIFGSRKESAMEFRKWVTSEVLPAVRRTGGFIPTKFGDTPEDIINRAKDILKLTLEEKDNLIENQRIKLVKAKEMVTKLKPYYEITRHIIDRENLFGLERVAKIIHDNNNKIGRNTFIGLLRDLKILKTDNTPYQKFLNSGHFKVKIKKVSKYDEFSYIPVTLVTGKGLVYLTNRVLKHLEPKVGEDLIDE